MGNMKGLVVAGKDKSNSHGVSDVTGAYEQERELSLQKSLAAVAVASALQLRRLLHPR